MRILALDCCGAAVAAAILRDGEVLAQRREPMERGHAERVLPLLVELLGSANADFPDIDLLAVTTGPGSFMGLRVGLAAIGGISRARSIPAIGVSTFDALFAAIAPELVPEAPRVLAVDSRRDEPFVELRDSEGRVLTAGALAGGDRLAAMLPPGPLVVAGDAAAVVTGIAGPRATVLGRHVDPTILARLAAARAAEARVGTPPPLYMKAPDAVPGPR